MHPFSVSILGSDQVIGHLDKPIPFKTRKSKALFFYLLMESGRAHNRVALTTLLWPEQAEQKGRNNLRQSLYRLRQTLEDKRKEKQLLLLTKETVQLDPSLFLRTDALAFKRVWERIRGHKHQPNQLCSDCINHLQRMQELYRGPFLDGFDSFDSESLEAWHTTHQKWYLQETLKGLEKLIAHFRQHDLVEACQYAERLIELEPLHEQGRFQLLDMLGKLGKFEQAQAIYDEYQHLMVNLYEMEPSEEIVTLYNKLKASRLIDTATQALRTPLPVERPFDSSKQLFGRGREVGLVQEALAQQNNQIVCISGEAGVGKSALLQRVINLVSDIFITYRLVKLSPQNGTLIKVRLQQVAGTTTEEPIEIDWQILPDLLSIPSTLLVIDDYHLLNIDPSLIYQLQSRLPHIKLLISSRVQWEGDQHVNIQINPFDIFSMHSASAKIFIDAACETFQVEKDYQALTLINKICRRLSGNPLLIQMAASWVGVLPLSAILAEIEKDPSFLKFRTGPTTRRSDHESLYKLSQGWWNRLTKEQQATINKLRALRYGFTREMAEQAAALPFGKLVELQEDGLLTWQPEPQRYQIAAAFMYQPNASRKQPEPQNPALRSALLDFIHRDGERLYTQDQVRALAEWETHWLYIKEMWRDAVQQNDCDFIYQAGPPLMRFTEMTERYQTAQRLFDLALTFLPIYEDPSMRGILGMLLTGRGRMSFHLGKTAAALDDLSEGFEHLIRSPYPGRLNNTSGLFLAQAQQRTGDFSAAKETLARLPLDESGDIQLFYRSEIALVRSQLHFDEQNEARVYLIQAQSLKNIIGDLWGIASIHKVESQLASMYDRHTEAIEKQTAAVNLLSSYQNRLSAAREMLELSRQLLNQSYYSEAERRLNDSKTWLAEGDFLHYFQTRGTLYQRWRKPTKALHAYRQGLDIAVEQKAYRWFQPFLMGIGNALELSEMTESNPRQLDLNGHQPSDRIVKQVQEAFHTDQGWRPIVAQISEMVEVN